MEFDHLVVNALRGLDSAADLFARLGFQLTPRGHHSLGSINYLMMDPVSYLEIVGVPSTGRQRQDVLESPSGLSGLVFRSKDAEATYARLVATGFAPQEPLLLERPVEIDGVGQMARFRNVRMTSAEFPAGRVYFCQHLTPELVWRHEWLVHPNGFCGLAGIGIAAPDPAAEAARFAALTAAEAHCDARGWRVGEGGFVMRFQAADQPRFVDATLLFLDPGEIARRASALPDVEWHGSSDGVSGILTVPELDLTLECCANSGTF